MGNDLGPFKLITGAADKDAWLEVRRQGLCGSDFAGVMGVSKWTSPATVYADKMGLLPPTPTNEPMYWGTALESAIADRYQEETGIRLQSIPKWAVAQHEDFPWWLGTPDRLAAADPDLGVEIKTARTGDGWGEPGTDEIPDHYLIQSASYMAVTKRKRWDVAVLIGGQDFRIYHLQESPDLTEALRIAGERFWHEHVLAQTPPAMDGTEACGEMLKKLWPSHRGSSLLTPTDDQRIYAKQVAHWRTVAEAAERERDAWINALKAEIGDAPGMNFGAAGTISWKQNKDNRKTDWEAVAKALAPFARPDVFENLIKDNTKSTPGARPFLFKVEGDQL